MCVELEREEEMDARETIARTEERRSRQACAVVSRLVFFSYQFSRVVRVQVESNANVHRGAHALATKATDAYEKARETVARFVGPSGVAVGIQSKTKIAAAVSLSLSLLLESVAVECLKTSVCASSDRRSAGRGGVDARCDRGDQPRGERVGRRGPELTVCDLEFRWFLRVCL